MAERDLVLVVDDEPDIREALEVLFHDVMELEVLLAPTARDGLLAMEKSGDRLRLIVSDYKMPQMDGLQFLAEANRRYPNVPRILLTAFADTQLAVDALNQAHVSHFLTKPVDPEQMQAVVARVLAAARTARQRDAAFRRVGGPGSGGSPP